MNASTISEGLMGMAPGGFMTSREAKPDLNQSLQESPFKRSRRLGGTAKKTKPKFVPGVTPAVDNSDEEEQDQTF